MYLIMLLPYSWTHPDLHVFIHEYLDLFIIVIFLLTGSNVQVPSEVILLNAMVLPDKSLGGSCKNQIIL